MNQIAKLATLAGGGVLALAFLATGTSEPSATSTATQTANTVSAVQQTQEADVKHVVEESTIEPVQTIAPAPARTLTQPKTTQPSTNCHPNYSGCLKVGAGDYDCAGGTGNGPNYTGAVRVNGADPFDLDRDNDGWGCE